LPYCAQCGKKYEEAARFCSVCGVKLELQIEEKVAVNSSSPAQPNQITIHEKGRRLESMLESVLQSQNFQTEMRKSVKGFSGNNWEIDVWAENDSRIIAVECKNYSNPIGTEKLTHFKQKIDEIKKVTSKPIEPLFVTASYFSTDAENFAKVHGIMLWDYDQLSSQYMRTQLGRNNIDGQRFDLALPIYTTYEEAIRLPLINQDLVALKKVILQWHPYYKISYDLSVIRRLPNRDTHTESFSGYVVYDANTNQPMESSIEDRAIISDLKGRPATDYKLEFNDTFVVDVQSPRGPLGTIKKLAVRRIIDRHTSEIEYQVRSRDSYTSRSFKVVPAPKEVLITGSEMIFVPKWRITYEIGGKDYRKRVLAASGTVVLDELSQCSKQHGIVDKLKRYDDLAYAICEKCFNLFCEAHTVKIGDRCYCKEHDPTPKPEKKGFSLFKRK